MNTFDLDPTTATAEGIRAAMVRGWSVAEARDFVERAIWYLENEATYVRDNFNPLDGWDMCREDENRLYGLKLLMDQLGTKLPDFMKKSFTSGPKINVRGGLKVLVRLLSKWETDDGIDHITDQDAALLFTVDGSPVNPDSLKSTRWSVT